MGRKKKPFIDKKNSTTFHVVHRSQRDIIGADEAYDEYYKNQEAAAEEALQEGGDGGTVNKEEEASSSSSFMHQMKRNLAKNQSPLLDDAMATYNQHTKPTSGGLFIHANGTRSTLVNTDATNSNPVDLDIKEVDRQLDSIALTADCMDEDMAQILFGDNWKIDNDDKHEEEEEEEVFEALNDDFVLMASAEPETDPSFQNQSENKDDNAMFFDYEAHIQHLMEQAHKKDAQRYQGRFHETEPSEHAWAKEDYAYFDNKGKALHACAEEEEDDSFANVESGDELQVEVDHGPADEDEDEKAKQEVLLQKFHETLAEYEEEEDYENAYILPTSSNLDDDHDDDDDDVDEEKHAEDTNTNTQQPEPTPSSHPNNNNLLPATTTMDLHDKRLDSILDSFLSQKEKYGLHDAKSQMLTQKLHKQQQQQQQQEKSNPPLATNEPKPPIAEIVYSIERPPPKELHNVFEDGKSYITTPKEVNPWDCESILTTYSNLDNRPTVIGSTNKKKKNKKKQQMRREKKLDEERREMEEGVAKIQLSAKSGLPLGVSLSHHPADASSSCYQDPYLDHEDVPYEDEEDEEAINLGEARPKNESKEAKKERKLIAKLAQREARLQKRYMKEAYRQEWEKKIGGGGGVCEADVRAGTTVFRLM